MKRYRYVISMMAVALLTLSTAFPHKHRDTLGIGQTISFVENKTQWDSNIRFKAQLTNATLFFENRCFTILLSDPNNPTGKNPEVDRKRNKTYRTHAYKVHFEGAKIPEVLGKDKQDYYENYYIGSNRSKWSGRVGVYDNIAYVGLYPNIDMNVYGQKHQMKYDFVVQPGGNPDNIALRYEGIDGLSIRNGNIILKTSITDIVEVAPYAFQIVDGNEIEVDCQYILDKKQNKVSFAIGNYNKELPLVIDPTLIFSTYTGSTADNWGTTATYDIYGNTYSSGVVFAVGYPTQLGALDSTFNGNADVGIFKLNSDGDTRIYATYLGGAYADMPHSMFVNEFQELVIMGTTGSSNFPTTRNAYDTTFNGGTQISYLGLNGYTATINYFNGVDIFVSRLSADGTQLAASTYIGGTGNDGLNYKRSFSNNNYNIIFAGNDSLYCNYGDGARGELITDDLNNIYVGTCTFSNNFPVTPGCFQPNYGGRQDGVVFKLDYNLSNLLWSSYIGGSGDDAVFSIDTDKDYNLLVAGGTNSPNFVVTPNAYQTTYKGGGADCFISKISYHGTQLMSSTLYGSDSTDQAYFVRVAKNDDVYIFGQTRAYGSTMIYNANYNTPNSGQLLARFKPNLDSLEWSTVFGTGIGRPNISPTAFAVDICNKVYCAGWGRDFCGYNINGQVINWNTYGTAGMQTSLHAIQETTDGQDFYIMAMKDDASALEYATFFGELHLTAADGGGDHVDGGTSRFDKKGTLYQSVCASCNATQNFPTTSGAWDTVNRSGNCNNGIFKMNIVDDFAVAEFMIPPAGCSPDTITFQNFSRGDTYYWHFGDSTYSTDETPTHIYHQPGIYQVTLIANVGKGCWKSDTITKELVVLGNGTTTLDTIYTCRTNTVQLGMQPQAGYTYRWLSSEVSDSTIANPYITFTDSVTLALLVDNGTCVDTMLQTLLPNVIETKIIYDTLSCINPLFFTVETDDDSNIVSYQWSRYRDFSDTLNFNMSLPDISLYIDTPRYYYVRVVNRDSCEGVDSILADFNLMTLDLELIPPSCNNRCDATVEVTISNGTPDYIYVWDDVEDTSSPMLCPGPHSLVVTDSKGCMALADFVVPNTEPLELEKDIRPALCDQVCDGSITISMPYGYEGDYTILWLDNNSSDMERTNLCMGIYIVRVEYGDNCVIYDTIAVSVRNELKASKTTTPSCSDKNCDGTISIAVTDGTEPYTYAWNNGATGSYVQNLCSGIYSFVVTDAMGCQLRDTVYVKRIGTFDSIEVWADKHTVFKGEAVRLSATQIPAVSYLWTPSESVEEPYNYTTLAYPPDTTIYTLTATDTNNCKYVDTLKINSINLICGRPNLFIPNTFSPNGDGVNDKMCFSGEWITEFHIAIFSRWGEKVFETNDINECWDGTFKGERCQTGVYMYTCDIVCEDNQKGSFKGDVTIIQ